MNIELLQYNIIYIQSIVCPNIIINSLIHQYDLTRLQELIAVLLLIAL